MIIILYFSSNAPTKETLFRYCPPVLFTLLPIHKEINTHYLLACIAIEHSGRFEFKLNNGKLRRIQL